MSAPVAAALLSLVMLAPIAANFSNLSVCGFATEISEAFIPSLFSSPSAKAPPIAPAPIIDIFMMFL
jgi:hypothetical protein